MGRQVGAGGGEHDGVGFTPRGNVELLKEGFTTAK